MMGLLRHLDQPAVEENVLGHLPCESLAAVLPRALCHCLLKRFMSCINKACHVCAYECVP